MAEFVFRTMAVDAGLSDHFIIASAATTDEEIWNGCGNPVYPPVEQLLKAHGMDPDGKRAALLRRSDYSRYDYFIGMDEENIYDLRRIAGTKERAKKIRCLADYLSHHPGQETVPDPYYGGAKDFEFALDLIEDACEGLLQTLTETSGIL